MLALFKSLIKSNIYLTAFVYIVYNMRIRWRLRYGDIKTRSGTTHSGLDINDSLNYILNVFRDYQAVSGRNICHGKVAEIGPGDNAGVACLFLAHGAECVDLADRFFSLRDEAQQQAIHQALQNENPNVPNISPDGEIPGVQRFYGSDAAGETFFLNHKGYNTIISRSVLEHVDEPELVLRRMFDALNPGGALVHKVDLRDHGMMTPYSHDLKWMEIPEWLFQCMVRGSGYPNRFLFHEYKRVLCSLNPNCRFYIAGLNGVEALDTFYKLEDIPPHLREKSHQHILRHRQNLARHLRDVPLDDLMVSSFFFVCEKPDALHD